MKNKSIKNKKLLVAIGIITVCTVLITAGILKLVSDSKSEYSVETLEKNKISNLFNIKQAEGDLEEEPSSSSSRPTSSSVRTSTSSEGTTSSSDSTSTQKKNNVKAVSISTSSAVSDVQQTQTSPNLMTSEPTPNQTQTPTPSQNTEAKNEEANNTPTTPVEAVNNNITGYTITINNAISGHTYKAYQIFTGGLYESEGSKVLSNIEWGNEFKKNANEGSGKTYGDIIIENLKAKYNVEKYFDNCSTAADVAEALSQNSEIANEFSIIVGNIINDPNNNISTEHITSNKTFNNAYEITGLEQGYYIVIDANIADKDDAHSRYFLEVVSDVEMEVKTIVPYLEKTVSGGVIIDNTENKYNTVTYYKNDNSNYNLTFNLKATIPTSQSEINSSDSKEYLTEYENYEYRIIDIVDKGFDLKTDTDEIPEVIVRNSEGDVLEDINYTVEKITEANKNLYKIDNLTPYAEKTIFGITINDIKTQVKEGKLNPGDVLTFEYNAKLNGSHNLGDNPNINEAYLIYSDNPHDKDSVSRTTENKTYTYSIDLELSKIAELKNPTDISTYLPNAVFEIYNEDKTIKIDELTCGDEGDTKGYAKYTSLGAGTYYIREAEAPYGYNKLKEDIKLVIASELDNGTIKWHVSIEKTPEVNKLVHLTNEKTEENHNNNGTKVVEKDGTNYRSIFIEIENTSGVQLPITGGIGTVIFTVIGLSIMAVAVIALKLNKKK